MIDLSPDAWGAVGIALTTVGTILAAHISTSRKVEEVRQLSAPTGNGFAADVKASLRRIEDKVDRHIEDHAQVSVRPWKEMR